MGHKRSPASGWSCRGIIFAPSQGRRATSSAFILCIQRELALQVKEHNQVFCSLYLQVKWLSSPKMFPRELALLNTTVGEEHTEVIRDSSRSRQNTDKVLCKHHGNSCAYGWHSVLVTFLLSWQTLWLIQERIHWVDNFREGVHHHHGEEHGSKQAGIMLGL